MKKKEFIISCAAGGAAWIFVSIFLMLLSNPDEFSMLIGFQSAAGISLSLYAFLTGKKKKFDLFYYICFLAYFIFVMFSLPRITSGRVVLTAMTLILSFAIFQKGFNDWREKCC